MNRDVLLRMLDEDKGDKGHIVFEVVKGLVKHNRFFARICKKIGACSGPSATGSGVCVDLEI